MSVSRALPLLLPFAFAACAPSQPPADPPAPSAPATADEAAAGLDGWHWQLSDAVDAGGDRIDALFVRADRPLQLDFADGHVGISGGCNRIGGSYAIEGQRLQVGELVQTLMACPEQALMALDTAASTHLQGRLQWRREAGDPPTLTLVTAGDARLTFIGEPTARTRYGGPGERMFLEVAAQRTPCQHPLIPDMQCLRVREVHYGQDGLRQGEPGQWQPLYEEIEGYEHQPGVRNVIRVDRFTRDPAPADASSIVYVHDMTVESAIEPPTP